MIKRSAAQVGREAQPGDDRSHFAHGMELFLERSELNRAPNALLAVCVVVALVLLVSALLQRFDGSFPGSRLVSQALVPWCGLFLISQLVVRRAQLKARWGTRAFSIAFRWFALPGLALIGIGIAHLAWIEGDRLVPREIALVPVVYLLISGIWLDLRAFITFGMDRLSMLYVYFPDEGRLVESNVYSVVRHPIYSAALRIAFALVLENGSAFALFAGVMVWLTLAGWVHWVEEPELIERFGESYLEYRRRVPAFFNLNPRSWLALWKFMVAGG